MVPITLEEKCISQLSKAQLTKIARFKSLKKKKKLITMGCQTHHMKKTRSMQTKHCSCQLKKGEQEIADKV